MLNKLHIIIAILTLTACINSYAQPAGQTQATPAANTLTPIDQMPAGIYQLDKNHASLVFKVNHMGLSNYTAKFTDFSATLTYDPQSPAKSKLEVTVNPLSIKTDYPNPEKTDFDKELSTGETWFNAAKFPAITFASDSIFILSDNKTGIVHGNLTMLRVSKPLNINVTFNGAYKLKPVDNIPAMGFSATAEIKRSDWGLTTSLPTVGDTVKVLIEVEFSKAS